jgi:amino acid transporter
MSTVEGASRYPQQLRRVLGVTGSAAISLSNVSPTASVFVTGAVLFTVAGSGAFYSLLIGAAIALSLALCWSELGAAFPVAGGDYALVARVLGRPVGFLVLSCALVQAIVIPSSVTLGAGEYVSAFLPGVNQNAAGAVLMAVTSVIAVLSIRSNAWVTGFFLVLELLAVVFLTALGFAHANQPVTVLFVPQAAHRVEASAVLAGSAVALLAYGGYQSAVNYSEEMRGSRRNVAHAVLWSLAITLLCEIVPLMAALVGAPSLTKLSASPAGIQYVVESLAGVGVNRVLSVAVVLAIFNSAIAVNLHFARVIFSSGRDRAWPEPISTWLATVHGRLGSPWVATVLLGAIGTLITALSSIAAVITFLGALNLIVYSLIATSAIMSRIKQPGLRRPYRLPLWPLPPLVALAGMVLVVSRQQPGNLAIAGLIVMVGAIYYVLYLRPRAGRCWVMLAPAASEETPLT